MKYLQCTRTYLLFQLLLEGHELLHVVLVLLLQPLLGVLQFLGGALVLLPQDGGLPVVVRVLQDKT